MGVPGFYRWLVNRYPLIRRQMSDVSRPSIDNFYIDFNCIIYNAIRIVHPREGDVDLPILFDEICRYLDVLVQIIRPQSVLFIAVDGPAPFAKCTQQRSRRFVSARDSTPGSFSTTGISVGTHFMEKLHQHLQQFFALKVKTDITWQKPQVIYSSHRTPGEGEHKFFEYIRNQKNLPGWGSNRTHCVYSPDADLIFLCLQTKERNFYIMREWDAWVGPHENTANAVSNKLRTSDVDFELINLQLIRDYLKMDYKCDDVDDIILDFCAFSFLIGNDFIPHFPDLQISQGDFDIVVQTYQKCLLKKNLHLIEDGKFNKQAMHQFLTSVTNKISKKSKKEDQINPDLYLQQKYPNETDYEALKKRLSFTVLDAFDWVLQYYTKGCQSWTWCFDSIYPPPLSIVSNYVMEHESHFDLDRPPKPFEQLLCILPSKCSDLLPPCLGQLMHEEPLNQFYPETFSIDLNYARHEHEGIVKIPLVDVKLVREMAALHESELTQEEQVRNTLIESSLVTSKGIIPFNNSPAQPVESPYNPQPGSVTLFTKEMMVTSTTYRANCTPFSKNRSSPNPSVILHIDQSAYKTPIPNTPEKLKGLIGKVVLVDWPYLKPGLVMQVLNKDVCYSAKGHTQPKCELTMRIADYLKIYGINVEDTQVFLSVKIFQQRNIAATRFDFSNDEILVPFQLTMSPSFIPNCLIRYQIPPRPLPNVDDFVVIENETGDYQFGIIKQMGPIPTIELCDLQFENVPTNLKELREQDTSNNLISLSYLSAQFKIEESVLHRILFTLPTNQIGDDSFDLSYTLHYGHKYLEGYAFEIKSEVRYSRALLELLSDYFVKLGTTFYKFLQEQTADDHIKRVNLDQVFSDPDHQFPEFLRWMKKETPVGKHYLMESGHVTVSQIALDELQERMSNVKMERKMTGKIVEIPLNRLIWKGEQKHITKGANIFSRIMTINECGPIPFGTFGTIVAIDKNTREASIMADEELRFGHNLRNRLHSKRGFVMKLDDCIFL